MKKYKFFIQTSDRYITAGSRCYINVKLTGENGVSTKWHSLGRTSIFTNTFQRGSVAEYEIEHNGNYIGYPVMLTIKLGGLGLDYWLCDSITVEYEGRKYKFIIFEWIDTKEQSFILGNARLPQNETSKFVHSFRKFEIEENKKFFQWSPDMESKSVEWQSNRYIKGYTFLDLPRLFRRTYGRLKCLGVSSLKVLYHTATNFVKGFFTTLQDLDDYKALYRHLGREDPYFIDCWKTDEEMGRQVLHGISPLAFARCFEIPQYCNIDDSTMEGVLPMGKTLSSEIEAGKVYIADYSRFTTGVKRNMNPQTRRPYVCADCIGFFYYRQNGDFVPIAIQLEPNDPESIFTSNNAADDWLLAKIYFRSTMQIIHEWIYHFFYTHSMSETFAVATFRCFSRAHPLYKLLRNHLMTAPSINTDARFVIFPGRSLANKSLSLSGVDSLRKAYETFTLEDLDIPKVLKKNGTDDKSLLPIYYYRDDALDIWEVLKNYVERLLLHFYKSDLEVEEDFELQSWARDLAMEGFAWRDGNKRGVPDVITSVQQLIHLCTVIIFTSSAQHAAVNFGQMETYQFIPNSPGAMRLPFHKKGEANTERMINTLPSLSVASLSISFSYALSEYADDEVFLGQFPERMFLEPEVIEIQDKFSKDLEELSLKFKQRNKTLKQPYTYLLPEKIPNSIAI